MNTALPIVLKALKCDSSRLSVISECSSDENHQLIDHQFTIPQIKEIIGLIHQDEYKIKAVDYFPFKDNEFITLIECFTADFPKYTFARRYIEKVRASTDIEENGRLILYILYRIEYYKVVFIEAFTKTNPSLIIGVKQAVEILKNLDSDVNRVRVIRELKKCIVWNDDKELLLETAEYEDHREQMRDVLNL
jgi:hypothetical protein